MIIPENEVVLNDWIEKTTDGIGTLAITDSPSVEYMKELFEEYYELRIRITPLDDLINEKQNN
jgi:hypothetical protein